MTINSETRVAGPFDGNDSTVSFPFTFKVFDSDEVRVVAETGAVETDLALGTDYAVTLNADQNAAPGGSVVLVDPLATGTRLTITSALEMLQPVDLTNQGGFYPRVINSALDRLTILLQQLASVVSRTLKFPLSDGPVGDMPGRAVRAGTVLAFDEATGEPVAGPDISSVNGVAGALVAVNTVAGNIADVNTVADNIVDVSNFSGVYYGPSATNPTTRRDGSPLQVGDLYFNTVTNAMRAYNDSAWRDSVTGAVTVQNLSGDGVKTEFLLDYAPESEVITNVFVNGVYQQKNTYALGGANGDVLIFNQAPPAGTNNIEVVVSSLTPSDDKLRQELANGKSALVDAEVVGKNGESLTTYLDRLPVVKTVGDGIADDWAVLQAALDTGRPHVFGGICRVSKELVAPSSGAYLTGLPGAVIDGSESGFVGSAVLSASGSLSVLPAPSGALAEGATNIVFAAAHGLVAGDVFCLWNPSGTSWSSFRTNYFAGEWCKVEQVISATEVLLANRLYDGYAAGVLEAHKLNAVPVDLRGFKVKGAISANAVSIVHGTGSIDLDVNHANNASVSVNRSYDITVSGRTFNVGSNSDDYGVAISNSQRVRVYGRHHARRHAVMHGGGVGAGSVPCRDSRVIGSTLSNDMTSGVHSADFHGNSEDCYFVDCNISGGGSLQGKNTGFINCRISNMLAGHVIQAAEIVGGKFVLHNCELVSTTNPTSGSRGVIQFDGGVTAETKERVLFAIYNCRVRARNMATNTYLARFTVRGSTVPVDFDFNGLDFDVDNMGTVLFTTYASGTALSNGISILGLSGNLPAGCILHNTAANAYLNSPQRLPKQTGSEVVTTSTTANTASGAAKTFRYAYPRKPVVSVTTSERGFIGGVSPNASAIPVSATGLTPVLFTPDATNFSAAVTVTLNWQAEISEF